MNREKLGSRLGFILLSAGCAIGIGNVWKFPYLTGKYGGGAFVLLYLIFLVLLGIPVMTMEFAVGRGAQKSPVRMFQELEKPGSKWHIHGYVCLIGDTLLMMYYTTVAGWMLQYFVRSAAGQFNRKDTEAVGRVYQEMLHQPGMLTLSMVVIVALGFFVCSIGLQSGLERVTKVIMPLLLLIMIVLALNSMFLKNASEGLNFFLVPDFGRMKEAGIIKVIVAAMNQAFFTLSVGIGSMAIFGSYIDKKHALLGESVNVALLDTFVAITAGMIIIPACFSYDVELTEGPGLIFVTLPNIFNDMPLGRLWGGLFFVFMCFAAFSTVLALFESIIACVMELTSWSRKKTSFICVFAMILLSLPCTLGFNVLSGFQPLGAGSTVMDLDMDLEDLIVSNFLLPVGALVFVLFCTIRAGWGWERFVEESNTGKGLKIPSWLRPYTTFVLPVIIIAVFVAGLIPFFIEV